MIIFPAVDIKDSRCVRLRQGLAEEVTVFGEDPVAMAASWHAKGARSLHIVDLDGAFSGRPVNASIIEKICALDMSVQLGGGIRDLETARAYMQAGVQRLIIGTMALEDPDMFSVLCSLFPGQVGVSLDAFDGQLKTRGWVDDAGLTIFDVLPRLEREGTAFIIYTDISRDGMEVGVNLEALDNLCEATRLPVIAAGGMASMDDIKNLYPLTQKGLEGAVTGQALYTGTLDLQEATAWVRKQQEADT